MAIIRSQIDTHSDEFKANEAAYREQVEALRQRVEVARQGGSAAARARHAARGKLLVRDRIERLLDPDTAFLELSPLAAYEV